MKWASLVALFTFLLATLFLDVGQNLAKEISQWKVLYTQGDQAFRQGNYAQAEKVWLKALAVAQKVDRDVDGASDVLLDLSALYSLQGKYDLETQRLKQRLDLQKEEHGLKSSLLAPTYLALGVSLIHQGRYTEAETLLRQGRIVVAGHKKKAWEEIRLMKYLAVSLYEQGGLGKRKNAFSLFRDYLKQVEKTAGPDHHFHARAALFVARYVSVQPAEVYLRRAHAIAKKEEEARPNFYTETMVRLADNLWKQEKIKEAKKWFQLALSRIRERQGEENEQAAEILNALGHISMAEGDLKSAEESHLRALKIRRRRSRPFDSKVAQSLYGLASVHLSGERFSQVEPLYRECLSIWKEAYGERHRFVLSTMEDYALLLRKLNRTEKAQEIEKELARLKDR